MDGVITNVVSIRDELMISTNLGKILRYRWDGSQNLDYCLDLKRIPFCIDQQVSKGNNYFHLRKQLYCLHTIQKNFDFK